MGLLNKEWESMQSIRNISPILRAVGVIGAVALLVTSVTFAALSDEASLTGNTVTSATADLNVWDGSAWAGTGAGFDVNELIPGTWSAPYAFYLQNASPFAMDISVRVPVAPTLTNVASLADVEIRFHDETQAVIATTDLDELVNSGPVALNDLLANSQGSTAATADEGDYYVTFNLDPTGVSGTQADVPAFNFVFTGEQVVTP
jgi:predicted ribosomally synthesized peptide with SipW-like signal peptide